MSKKAEIIFQDHRFIVSGEIDFSNAATLYEKSLPQLNLCKSLIFDFALLKTSDSSGLALMIEWLKFSKLQQKKIQFLHVPPELLAIAQLAGIEKLIFLQV